ncbi:MAG: hypothetical protein AB1458_09935 [Bacteroidota bacterium]
MKKSTLFVLVLLLASFISAQSQTLQWTPIFLNPKGDNLVDGVEAYFARGTCDGKEVVFIKFINHNSYNVKISFYDAVFTQDIKWVNKQETQRTIEIASKSEAIGQCGQEAHLVVDLATFISSAEEFKKYCSAGFTVTPINQ